MASATPGHTTTSLEMNWRVLYQRFSIDIRSQTLPPGMVKLQSWPDLATVPDEFIGTVVRICALLWSKPTASHLITHVLGEDRQRINLLLQTLYALGHVEFVHHDDATQTTQAITQTKNPPSSSVIKTDVRASFIDKLRQQLLGHHFLDDTPIA